MMPNPFEVLRLDPRASEEEIVSQAGSLRQRMPDETNLDALRQAVQTLTSNGETRLLQALLTHPRPGHQAPALDKFVAAHRRAPASTVTESPLFDEMEFSRLLLANAAEELTAPATVPFEPCGGEEGAEEIHQQAAEVLWTSLIHDSRA